MQREDNEQRIDQQTDWYLTRLAAEKTELEDRYQKALERQAEKEAGIQSQLRSRIAHLESLLTISADKKEETDQRRVSAETQAKEQGKWIERLDRQLETERQAAAEKIAGLEQQLADLREKPIRGNAKTAGAGKSARKVKKPVR